MKLNIRKRNNKPSIIIPPTLNQTRELARYNIMPEETECLYCQSNIKCSFRYMPQNVGKCSNMEI